MDGNRINGFVERSSVNGRENIAKSFDVLQIRDWDSRVTDNESRHKADLRESVRQETKNAEERFAIKRPLYGQQAATSSHRVRNRRRSDVQSLPKALIAPQFTNTRRKSTSELERTPDDSSMSNSRPNVSQTASVAEGNMCDETSATSTKNEHSIYDSDRASVVETWMFPVMSRVNVREQSQLSSSGPRTHRKESKGNRLKSGESVTVGLEQGLDGERLARSPTHKISLPAHAQGNMSWMKASDLELTRLTRSRSFSDSEVEDSVRMSVEQREKLERLKYQILESNSNRKNTKKVSGETKLPVLTEKSLKRYSRSHEMAGGANADQKISTVFYVNSTKVKPADSAFAVQNPDSDRRHTSVTEKCDTSFNTDKSRGEFIAPLLSTLAYSEIGKRKSNGSDFPTPPTSEEGDLESISVIIDRLRARSEPGDVGTRKVSSVQQLHAQTRTRSETDDLKTKVQSFVKKPLPALPPSTLRVKKKALNEVTSKSGHFKAGNANVTSETQRERKEGAINIHTCPNRNLLSDRSWMYQDESRKRHRYIRGPATPVPPVDFVFRKDNPHDRS